MCVISKPGLNFFEKSPSTVALASDKMAGVAAWVFLEIILMLFFGGGEGVEWFKCCDDRVWPAAGIIHACDHVFGCHFLFFGCVKNGGTIACTDVVPLLVSCGGIVDAEKEIQQGFVAGFCRVVRDLERFGVAGMVLVGGMFVFAAGVSGFGIYHAWLCTE